MFESRISAGRTQKITKLGKATRKDSCVVLRHGKDMLENALCDSANWQTKKWSSFTKFQVLAWMVINTNRKNLNQSENYDKYAHKMSSCACTWRELGDQTFCGLSTNLQEQSQNGLRHVTDDWQDWFHTFIT